MKNPYRQTSCEAASSKQVSGEATGRQSAKGGVLGNLDNWVARHQLCEWILGRYAGKTGSSK
nr:unnamed protein product [Callosobruchus analis]